MECASFWWNLGGKAYFQVFIEPKGKHLAGDENDSEIRNKFESEFQKTLKIGGLTKNYPEEKNKSLKVADEI